MWTAFSAGSNVSSIYPSVPHFVYCAPSPALCPLRSIPRTLHSCPHNTRLSPRTRSTPDPHLPHTHPHRQTAASFLNVVGTALALAGVFAYSVAERQAGRAAAAGAGAAGASGGVLSTATTAREPLAVQPSSTYLQVNSTIHTCRRPLSRRRGSYDPQRGVRRADVWGV